MEEASELQCGVVEEVIRTLKVTAGFGDDLNVCVLEVRQICDTILIDAVEVDVTGVGAALYDKLTETKIRSVVKPYSPLANYSTGLLKK